MRKLFFDVRNWPLANQLVANILLVALIGVAATTLSAIQREQRSFQDELQRDAVVLLDTISGLLTDSLIKLDTSGMTESMEGLREDDILGGRIYDANGRIIADAVDNAAALRLEPDPFGLRLIEADTYIFEWKSDRLLAGKPVRVGNQAFGAISLEFSLAPLEARIVQTRNQGLLTAFLLALFAVGLGLWFSRSITSPMQSMILATQRMAAGDYTALVQTRGAREFGTLAESYNRMASRLRETLMSLEARARALATSAQVGRHLSALLDQEHLVKDVVEQVRMAFNYYHAQIYLMDDETGDMILAGGTGRAGKILLENRHRVSKGRGLVGRAAETRRLILVPDTTKDADWLPNPHLPATKSEIAVPIIAGDQILGVLDVQNNVENSLTEQDADLLSSIANQVGIALQNARQYQVSQKVARELGVVADIAVATTAITDVKRLLQEAVDRIKSASGLYHAGIYLFNEAGTTLELAAGAGEIGRQMVAEGRSIPLNQEKSLVALTAHALKGLMVNDVRADPHFLPDPLLPETHSQQTAPMIVGGRVIGVLDVQSGYVNHFTEIDVNIRTTLATQIAVTLQSARAFNQVRRQAEYETQLNLINQKIQSAADVDAVLQITARELGSVLGARRTVAHLGMKDKNNAN